MTNYLFVDGRNFRTNFSAATEKWFGRKVEFDFRKIKKFFDVEKAFYYDCIDDEKKPSENDLDYAERVALQERELNEIREIDRCHVYLGSITGRGKKRRQKEVDVLLAVDMMEHAIRGNMKRAVLLSGDRDFRPLIQSIVRLGLIAEVAGDKEHISEELIYSADRNRKLSLENYLDWTKDKDRSIRPFSIQRRSFFPERAVEDKFTTQKNGKLGEENISLYRYWNGEFVLHSQSLYNTQSHVALWSVNENDLSDYITITTGKHIIWEM